MKRFKGTSKDGKSFEDNVPHPVAASVGWGLPSVGYELLDDLEVGEATIDDDGDTWERVE